MIDLLVLGGGALGRGFAALAARRGARTACITRDGAIAEAILRLKGVTHHGAMVPPAPAGVVLVCTKAPATRDAVAAHAALVAGSEAVVVAQNGLDVWLPPHPAAARAIVWACAEREGALSVWSGPARLALIDGAGVRSLEAVLAGPGVQVEVVSAERMAAYEIEKLMVNASLNTLCALTGLPPGPLFSDAAYRERAVSIATEVAALGYTGQRSPEEVVATAARAMGLFAPSMLQDARAGAPLETDELVESPRRALARRGIAAPALARLSEELAAFACVRSARTASAHAAEPPRGG